MPKLIKPCLVWGERFDGKALACHSEPEARIAGDAEDPKDSDQD